MTIGQRIALKRKELGLSQEALGEELGVSRQAIYKWESDGAVPEVEKLVQLARRFGVSVGWLLGVEETERRESTAEESGELTEQQLRMVEEIVSRYLAAQPKPPKQKKRGYVLAALALLAVVWSLFSRLEQLDNRYQSLQSSVSHMSSQVNSEIGSISYRVEEALKQQALFTAEYNAELVEMDALSAYARVSAYAVPKTYVEGMTAEFILESGGEVTTALVTDAPQQKFSAELECELTDDMQISVAFIHPDGTRDLQLLDSYPGYLSATYPSVWIEDFHLFGIGVTDGKVELQDFYVTSRDPRPGNGGAQVESVRLGLFRNQELLAWAEPCEAPQGWRGFEEHDFYRIPDMTVEMGIGDALQVAALVTDTFGREFMIHEVPYVVQLETGFDNPYLTYPASYESSRDVVDWKFD